MFPDPTPGLPYLVCICHLAGLAGSFCGFCSALSHKASELHVWNPYSLFFSILKPAH